MADPILIVEEDCSLREAIASRLRRSGVGVQEVSDTATAAEILDRHEIGVAVIGLAGLESDGLELLKICRSMQPPAEVILLVGKDQGALAIKGMKLGAFRDAQVPIHMESLEAIIREAQAVRAKKARTRKRSVVGTLSGIFSAVTFAEHGDFETARQLMDRDRTKTDKE